MTHKPLATSVIALALAFQVALLAAVPQARASEPTEPASSARETTRVVPLSRLLAVQADPAAETAPAESAPAPAPAQESSDELPPGLLGDEAPAPNPDAETEEAATDGVPEEEESVFKTWWFWALAGAVVIGTVALGVAASDTDSLNPARACKIEYHCFGDGR